MGDLLNDTLGLEPSDDELQSRYRQAFTSFDADQSGTLELTEVLHAFATLPMKRVKEKEVRAKFARFDADGSGALSFEEFCNLMNAARSAARVDAMSGVIYCAVGTPLSQLKRLKMTKRHISDDKTNTTHSLFSFLSSVWGLSYHHGRHPRWRHQTASNPRSLAAVRMKTMSRL